MEKNKLMMKLLVATVCPQNNTLVGIESCQMCDYMGDINMPLKYVECRWDERFNLGGNCCG